MFYGVLFINHPQTRKLITVAVIACGFLMVFVMQFRCHILTFLNFEH